jgi:hypothetical protein
VCCAASDLWERALPSTIQQVTLGTSLNKGEEEHLGLGQAW